MINHLKDSMPVMHHTELQYRLAGETRTQLAEAVVEQAVN